MSTCKSQDFVKFEPSFPSKKFKSILSSCPKAWSPNSKWWRCIETPGDSTAGSFTGINAHKDWVLAVLGQELDAKLCSGASRSSHNLEAKFANNSWPKTVEKTKLLWTLMLVKAVLLFLQIPDNIVRNLASPPFNGLGFVLH